MRFFLIGAIVCSSLMLLAKDFSTRLNYKICIPDQPSQIELKAAAELAYYLEKTYTENIKMNGNIKPILFSVGFSPEAVEFSKEKDGYKSSGFGVFCRNRTILLTGFDYLHLEEGTLLSVYYFLRKYTGLKVYAPDKIHGEKLGKNTSLIIPKEDNAKFSFSVRNMGRRFKDVSSKEMALYAKKQLCHEPYWSNFNIYYIVLDNWAKRFNKQPQLFGLYKGKRQSIKYPYHLPCLTNPKVKEIIVADILKMIKNKKAENHAVLRLFCDAPYQRCECQNCSKISNNDDYLYGFILSVWNTVKTHYPKTRLFLQEKGSSHKNPPSKGNLDGVVINISTGYPDKVDYSASQYLFKKWLDRGAIPTIRLYPRHPKWTDCPIINPHDIAANYRAMKGFAIGQRRSDCSFDIPYALAALTNYVHANLLLNVDANVDELIQDFCAFMYPNAAKEMVEFYTWMEKRQAIVGVGDDPYLKCYSYDSLKYPKSLLDAAAKKCTNLFWLSKLQDAFNNFVSKTKKIQHLTINMDKNIQITKQMQLKFKEHFSKPFNFTANKIDLFLCPTAVHLGKIQDSLVSIWSNNNQLNFNLTAFEENIHLLKRQATWKNPTSIWGDDIFEIMIAPEKSNHPYIQLAINANGVIRVMRHTKLERNQHLKLASKIWNSKAQITKNSWMVNLSIPMSLIREICPNNKGRIGIFRTRVLSSKDPMLKGFYAATYGLYNERLILRNHHNVSCYHPFTIK